MAIPTASRAALSALLLTTISAGLLLSAPSPAHAQEAGEAAQAAAEDEAPAEQAQGETFSVSARITQAAERGEALEPSAVILRAARPKGPFEQADPPAEHEWSAMSDETGVATFEEIPQEIATSGLRLQAVTVHNGLTFKSAQKVPAPGVSLDITLYEQSHDLSGVRIEELQTIAHIWENHIFFQQFYLFTVDGDQIINTAQLPGEEFKRGLPIHLPIPALGINIQAAGETSVLNSFAYWKGVLKPGETVPISITFSVRADSTTFVYEQEVDYPVDNAKIFVPLEANSPQVKIPYFDTVSLSAPDFEVDAVEGGLGGDNQGTFLVADGRQLAQGDSFAFQLKGLPYDEPTGGWIALGLGILGGVLLLLYTRKERAHVEASRRSAEVQDMLKREHEELLDELALLEQDYLDGEVGDIEYENESLLLRGRIALVMKKLGEITDAASDEPAEDSAA